MSEDVVVMMDSDEAAKRITVTGWVSRDGRFFGKDEQTARYSGCTHRTCNCGATIYKSYLLCDACNSKQNYNEFLAMPEADWDGVAMLYSRTRDEYYPCVSSALDALEEGEPEEVLQLVICAPNYAEINEDSFADELTEDGDTPGELLDAMDAFNKAMAGVVLSWTPGRTRLRINDIAEAK